MRTLIAAGTVADGLVKKLITEKKGELMKRFPSFFSDPERLPVRMLNEDVWRTESGEIAKIPAAVREIEPAFTDADREGLTELLRERAATRRTYAPMVRDPHRTVLIRPGADGFFAALWHLCELTGSGCDADIKKIPVCQETVEICEYFDLDPYTAPCGNMLLIAAADGSRMLYELGRRGHSVTQIGVLTGGRGRLLRYAGHTRFLDNPDRR